MRYAMARLKEASTWAGICGALTAASALPPPYGPLIAIAGVMAAILPGGRAEP